MRRSLLTAALLASFLLPAFPAPAEAYAAEAAGPGLEPSAQHRDTGPDPAPAPARRRADACASASLADLGRRVPFTVFAPRELPAGWVPAVCAYPPGGRRVYGLRIHLRAAWTALPPAGAREPRIAGIAQARADLTKLTDRHGKPVRLRGRTARFMPWHPAVHAADGRPVHGGILRWIEQGTLIEIDSRVLTKKQMIRLAESLMPLPAPPGGTGAANRPDKPPKPRLPFLSGNSILGMQGPDPTRSGRA